MLIKAFITFGKVHARWGVFSCARLCKLLASFSFRISNIFSSNNKKFKNKFTKLCIEAKIGGHLTSCKKFWLCFLGKLIFKTCVSCGTELTFGV